MDRTALTRMRELATTERSELDRLLDETLIAHIGLRSAAGGVMVVPTALVRREDDPGSAVRDVLAASLPS